jgi:hypothetical protein
LGGAGGLGDEVFEAADRLGLFGPAREYLSAPATGAGGRNATARDAAVGRASPYDLEPTDPPGAGEIGQKKIAKIRQSMRENGYTGRPVFVVVHEGKKYVVDGNHRLRASEGILDEIPYQVIDLPFAGFNTIDDVLRNWNMCREMLPDWMARRASPGAGA